MGRVTRLDHGPSAVALMGQRIKERREQLGMAQAALARHIDADKSAVNRIEKGTQSPSNEQLIALAMTLRVTFPWLLMNEGPVPAPFEIHPDDRDRRFRPDDPPDPDAPQSR